MEAAKEGAATEAAGEVEEAAVRVGGAKAAGREAEEAAVAMAGAAKEVAVEEAQGAWVTVEARVGLAGVAEAAALVREGVEMVAEEMAAVREGLAAAGSAVAEDPVGSGWEAADLAAEVLAGWEAGG